MVYQSNVTGGAGSCLGIVAIAVVSTGVILASYHLIHHRLESNNLELNNRSNGKPSRDQRRQSRKTKKKVRFADDLTDADTEECPASAAAAGSGKLVRPALRKAAYSSTRAFLAN